ncbi:TetR/AcrR family transcriptional regulator [Paenibacillus athensensis]|uniref:TetR/AcrR family transcriptional regulator n=1 Tax=Paenibacillus athensensis TaxID=1967502 RepID=UPI00106FF4C6|nr:TetR/AcrR family transcriptional regulator [Paenibacillus athensensis]MCD1259871.1 TetR/AcrR family transcriptional regulator [Paenibacillus athensensis]
MGIHYRRKHESESVRQQIVEVALELFLTQGYESVSMRKIAQHIQYSPTTIYNYFQDKQDVLFHLLKRGYGIFLDALLANTQAYANEPFLVQFRTTLHAYIRFGREHPDYYKLIFIHNPEQFRRLIDLSDSDRMRGLQLLESHLREGMELGVLRMDDVTRASRSVWASLHGLVHLLNSFPPFLWPEPQLVIDDHVELIIRSLIAPKARQDEA